MRLRELAVAAGIDPGRLIDEWHARADARACCGQDDDEAALCALGDVEGRLCNP